jgi:Flp pilus assembly protein TadB
MCEGRKAWRRLHMQPQSEVGDGEATGDCPHYHWLLLPLQGLAALTILVVGFARVEAGSHWVTDALAAYLSGALLLWVLIILYQRLPACLARYRASKRQEKAGQAR